MWKWSGHIFNTLNIENDMYENQMDFLKCKQCIIIFRFLKGKYFPFKCTDYSLNSKFEFFSELISFVRISECGLWQSLNLSPSNSFFFRKNNEHASSCKSTRHILNGELYYHTQNTTTYPCTLYFLPPTEMHSSPDNTYTFLVVAFT